MKNAYQTKVVIDDTQVNSQQVVPITEILRLSEVAAFNHANMIGFGHAEMEKVSHAFWIVTKIKVYLNGAIKSGDKVKIKTWTHTPGLARVNRDMSLKVGNSTKAKIAAEWCCLDTETRKIRKLSTINYPELEVVETAEVKPDFSNLKLALTEKDYAYTRTIRATDIDVNFHTNNLKYNFIALDALSLNELNSLNIKEYEIHYVNESREGDKIDVYKQKQKNYYYIEGRIADKTIFKVVIKFKKNKGE